MVGTVVGGMVVVGTPARVVGGTAPGEVVAAAGVSVLGGVGRRSGVATAPMEVVACGRGRCQNRLDSGCPAPASTMVIAP